METPDKIPPHSKLKTLPEERQSEIEDYSLTHTLAETVTWLQGQGIDVSASTVSKFLSWYRMRQQLSRNELIFAELFAGQDQSASAAAAERITELGQAFFASMALERQDPKAWYMSQRLTLARDRFLLACKKYEDQLLQRQAEQQKQIDAANGKGVISEEALRKVAHELRLI